MVALSLFAPYDGFAPNNETSIEADPREGKTRPVMTAGEQMFFLGAPLAHVVEFERLLRIRRLKIPMLKASRFTTVAGNLAAADLVASESVVEVEAA